MQNMMNQFRNIAPYIVSSVKGRVTIEMSDDETMKVVHEEILAFFEKGQQMTAEFLSFNADQRAAFAGMMYDMLSPLFENLKPTINPVYAAYVQRTGKTGALNFITNA